MPNDPRRAETKVDDDTSIVAAEPSPPPGLLLRLIKDQRVAFLLVGCFNTVLGWALFAVAQSLIGVHLGRFGYMLSLFLSYAVAIFCAFLLHRTFVFRVRGRFWLDLARFTMVNLLGLGLNALLLPVAIVTTGMAPVVAQGGVALVVAVLSYGGHKYFSFRRSAKHEAAVVHHDAAA